MIEYDTELMTVDSSLLPNTSQPLVINDKSLSVEFGDCKEQPKSRPNGVDSRQSDIEQRVIHQLQLLLSDEHMQFDLFLLEQQRLGDGWLPIALLSELMPSKCLKEYCNNANRLSALLADSAAELVQVNEDGTKIRRSTLKPFQADVHLRAIYSKGFPADVTLNDLRHFFSEFGDIEDVEMSADSRHGFIGSCFVVYKTIRGARNFLHSPNVTYNNNKLQSVYRHVYLQWQSSGLCQEHTTRQRCCRAGCHRWPRKRAPVRPSSHPASNNNNNRRPFQRSLPQRSRRRVKHVSRSNKRLQTDWIESSDDDAKPQQTTRNIITKQFNVSALMSGGADGEVRTVSVHQLQSQPPVSAFTPLNFTSATLSDTHRMLLPPVDTTQPNMSRDSRRLHSNVAGLNSEADEHRGTSLPPVDTTQNTVKHPLSTAQPINCTGCIELFQTKPFTDDSTVQCPSTSELPPCCSNNSASLNQARDDITDELLLDIGEYPIPLVSEGCYGKLSSPAATDAYHQLPIHAATCNTSCSGDGPDTDISKFSTKQTARQQQLAAPSTCVNMFLILGGLGVVVAGSLMIYLDVVPLVINALLIGLGSLVVGLGLTMIASRCNCRSRPAKSTDGTDSTQLLQSGVASDVPLTQWTIVE